MDKINHTDIVKKLIGGIDPIGKSEIDSERFENLKDMCNLVSNLVSEIYKVYYENKDRHEASIKKAAQYADNFLGTVNKLPTENKKYKVQYWIVGKTYQTGFDPPFRFKDTIPVIHEEIKELTDEFGGTLKIIKIHYYNDQDFYDVLLN